MSLKNIEMQIALPRTHDAGKIQDQLNQRNQQIQDQLAHSIRKEVDLKRTQVSENRESDKLFLNKGHSQQHQEQKKKRKKIKNKRKILTILIKGRRLTILVKRGCL